MICIEKIYGFQGLNHQTIKESWDVTPVIDERTNGGKWKIVQCSKLNQKPQNLLTFSFCRVCSHSKELQSMIRGLQGIGSPDELFILILFLPFLPTSQTENFSTYLRHCSFNAKFMASDIYFLIILNLVITKEWFGFFCGPILDICSC